MTFNFEKLIAWQKAKSLCIYIYKLTESLPKEEAYNFTSQIRRSAQSVTSNIAEGSAKSHKKEKRRFINIAYGSLVELSSQIIISNEIHNYIDIENLSKFKELSVELSKILSGLLKSYQDQ